MILAMVSPSGPDIRKTRRALENPQVSVADVTYEAYVRPLAEALDAHLLMRQQAEKA